MASSSAPAARQRVSTFPTTPASQIAQPTGILAAPPASYSASPQTTLHASLAIPTTILTPPLKAANPAARL